MSSTREREQERAAGRDQGRQWPGVEGGCDEKGVLSLQTPAGLHIIGINSAALLCRQKGEWKGRRVHAQSHSGQRMPLSSLA